MDATTVLLVDDEKEFVDTLAERIGIRSLCPQVAYSGEQALEMINDTVPDVMVLDLKMPGIGGADVLARVKSAHPDVSIIILTGHGDKKDQVLVEGMGASGYFQKPVDIDLLVAKIRVLG